MRYNIFRFSQEKLLKFKLDMKDALFLDWFNIFFSGNMVKVLFDNYLFGWVDYNKVINNLPELGITTEDGIGNRLKKLVQKGILEKRTKNTQHGKRAYFRPTEIFYSLLNLNENTKSSEENLHTNSISVSENNRSSFAQTNFHSNALKDSCNKNNEITDAVIITVSEKIFGKNFFDNLFPKTAAEFLNKQDINDVEGYFAFVKNKVTLKKLSAPRGYIYKLIFQIDIAQEFKEQQQQILLVKQQELAKAEAEETRKITCPICGTRFLKDFKTACPNCDFALDDFENTKKIVWQKKYIQLSVEKRKEFDTKLQEFLLEMPIMQRIKYRATPEGKAEEEKFMFDLNARFGLPQ